MPLVQLFPGIRWVDEIDREHSTPDGKRVRVKVRKPKLPWTYAPRSTERRVYTECGGRRIYHDKYNGPQGVIAAVAKLCGPRKRARDFDPGGPEAGTLAGARRAAGLFDYNWGTDFPLTRAEQRALQEGRLRFDAESGQLIETELRPGAQYLGALDPFLAPPTSPAPENWLEDKFQRLSGRFGPTLFRTPDAYSRFCPTGGYGISCAGPDGEVGWVGGSTPLTPLDVQRFKEAYCAPGQCQTGGKISPPPGFKEFVVKVKPRNPGTALKASCEPKAAPEPVVMDVPVPPPAAVEMVPPPGTPLITKGCPPGWYWGIGLTGIRCVPIGIGAPAATAADLGYFNI